MIKWNKLVRDRIPEIIKASGQEAVTRELDHDEFIAELRNKLLEETNELILAEGRDIIGEFADVLEVVNAYRDALNIAQHDIDEVRSIKASDRGTFTKRIYLVETHDSSD